MDRVNVFVRRRAKAVLASNPDGRALLLLAAFALLGPGLGGCASTIADLPVVGLPADAPARPAESRAYLPVNDLPANRDDAMAPAEQARLHAELVAARDRQAAAAAAPGR